MEDKYDMTIVSKIPDVDLSGPKEKTVKKPKIPGKGIVFILDALGYLSLITGAMILLVALGRHYSNYDIAFPAINITLGLFAVLSSIFMIGLSAVIRLLRRIVQNLEE